MITKFHLALVASVLPLVPMATGMPVAAQSEAAPLVLAQAPSIGYISADSVNVRSGPGTDRRVLYVARRGTQMQILGQYGRGNDS